MLKCTDCGKTFGANEPVVGITAEGEPEPGSPFCVKCANRTIWRVSGTATPLPDNPAAKQIGGANIIDFIRDGKQEDTERIIAGFQPVPYMAVYSASKAFVIAFSVALWDECRDRNVCVMALCPGTTSTNIFTTAEAPEAALGSPRTVEQVVATALAGLDKRRSLIIDGMKNNLLSHGPRLIPRWFAAKFAGQAVRPRL